MRKKIILILVCTFVFLNNVYAVEKEKSTIEFFKTQIVVYNSNKYSVNEEYNVFTKFGTNPSERYLYKLFKNNYSFYNNNKEIKSKVTFESISAESERSYGMNQTSEGIMLYLGESSKLLSETEKFKLNYFALLDRKEDNIYSYYISDNKYSVKKIDFTIVFPFPLDNYNVEFSLDNISYNKKIDGLKFEIKNKLFIEGSYENLLEENQTLSFRVSANQKVKVGTNLLIIIIPVALISILFIWVISYKKLTKNNKQI